MQVFAAGSLRGVVGDLAAKAGPALGVEVRGEFGGSGWGNLGGIEAAPVRAHGRMHSLSLTLPPLSTLILEHRP